MTIKKYLHSCLLVEDHNRRLLIDPGAFSFGQQLVTPEDIGPVDAALFTHKHMDHFYPEALKKFQQVKPIKIVAHQEVCDLLKQEGLLTEAIKAGETKEVEGFIIQAFEAPHETIPAPSPANLAFLINQTLFHPGDSLKVKDIKCRVLALPIAGPPFRLIDSLEYAKELKPEVVIPVHDFVIKDSLLEKSHGLCSEFLKKAGIVCQSLKLGEKLEI